MTLLNGPTLLELIYQDVLSITYNALSGRERVKAVLPPTATRGIFLATEGIKNLELLRILYPESSPDEVIEDGDTRRARFLRSVGKERWLPIDTLKAHCLALLDSGKVTKADIVRSWTYVAIHEGARLALDDAKKKSHNLDPTSLAGDFELQSELMTNAFNGTIRLLTGHLERAKKALPITQRMAEHLAHKKLSAARSIAEKKKQEQELAQDKQRNEKAYQDLIGTIFIATAAFRVLDTMDLQQDPMTTMHDLLDHIYPDIDQTDLQT